MAAIERYLVCASASSALTSVTSGMPRFTVAPSSTWTLVTIPPAIGVTLTSRYAFAITLPGTVTEAVDAPAVTRAVLSPARVTASGVRITSTSPVGSEAAGAGGEGAGDDAAGSVTAGARDPSVYRNTSVAPAAPTAIRRIAASTRLRPRLHPPPERSGAAP